MKKKMPVFIFIFLFAVIISGTFFYQQEKITKETIASVEILIGLNFNDAERDSMIDGLNEQLENYNSIRKFELANSIPPAILFNPLPVNFTFPKNNNAFILSDYSSTKLPVNKEELAFYSIGQLAYLIKNHKITSEELTKFYLNRLRRFSSELECVISLTEELALAQAKKADKEITKGKYRGILHGIPYGVKDLFSTKNYKTTWGATPYKDQIISEDAAVIKKLEEAGAVLIAKLSMGALAWGDVWFGGKTRNPWKKSEGSSGSSAGSASAVSAGLIPFALGTETYGSIVSPSTVCGVTGLRPTYGRVSRYGAMALSWSMDKIGPICRNAEDCAIVLNSIYGPDNKDQSVYNYPFSYNNEFDLKKIRVGYLKKDFEKDYDFKTNDSPILVTLTKLGANLIPIELPEFPVDDLSIILSAEAAAAFDELTRSGKDDLLVRQIKNAWPNVFRASRFIPAVEYINANRIRYELIQKMAEIMKSIDLYFSPSWDGDNLLLTNLTGHPCIVIPNGFSQNGTPTSISITGNLFDEGLIISAAKKIQDVTGFHLKHPDL